MKALTWQGTGEVRVEEVPDPRIEEPTDAVVRMTSTAICGSDLHLYDVLGMYLTPGDIIGHEPMGIVEEVGSEVTQVKPGDRVVIPFHISCGHCWMCQHGFMAQCETTQVREQGKGAALFGYTSLYGAVPGGQAEYLRVPQAHFGPIKVPTEHPDERWLFLSDILPTAWQSVKYADIEPGTTCAVIGLGPVGQFAARIARYLGAVQVIGVDNVPERLEMARRHGMFDKGVTMRMDQAHVKRWIDDIMPALQDDSDPLGTEDLTTHPLPLEQAPHGYEIFKNKEDGCIKVVLKP